jgi:rubrerythrin
MSPQVIYYCEALESAMEFEERSKKFYHDSVGKVEHELAKKTLEFLAKEEQHHIEKIKKINDELIKESQNFDFAAYCTTDLPERVDKHLKKLLGERTDKVKAQISDIEVYDLALDMEKAGYGVYKDYYRESRDEQTKRFLDFLIKEEKIHYDLISSTKRYLEDHSYYFEDFGGWIFGGV